MKKNLQWLWGWCQPVKRTTFETPHPDCDDAELLVGRGHQRLNEGLVAEAAEDLSLAVESLPEHGVALGLLAIASERLGDDELRGQVVDQCLKGLGSVIHGFIQAGSWYHQMPEPGSEPDPEQQKNRNAFGSFLERLVEHSTGDPLNIFLTAQSLYTWQLVGLCADVLGVYRELSPGHVDAEAMYVDSVLSCCDFQARPAFIEEQKRRLDAQLKSGGPVTADPFNWFAIGADFGTISKACALRSKDMLPASGPIEPGPAFGSQSRENRRLKIGIILPYSWFASVNLVLREIVPEFDRTRFEVFGYALNVVPDDDPFESSFKAAFDRFTSLAGFEQERAAQVIRDDEIDLAIDMSGHTRTTCLPVLAYRPAPVQTHLFGWGTIIEAPFIDYLITDEYCHTPHLQELSSETYAMMPDSSWCYPRVEIEPHGAHSVIGDQKSDKFQFCCFNHPGKIDNETFSAWMEILRSTKDSVLALCHWNLSDAVHNLRANAELDGVDPDRLRFLPVVSHDEHLRRMGHMDLALDTFYIGGGVTTMDCLWVGLPIVVACIREDYLHSGRGALGPLGLGDQIVRDVDGYVARAVELRNDAAALSALRRRILEARDRTVMFDARHYVNDLQNVIEKIWEKHEAGQPPTSFRLRPSED